MPVEAVGAQLAPSASAANRKSKARLKDGRLTRSGHPLVAISLVAVQVSKCVYLYKGRVSHMTCSASESETMYNSKFTKLEIRDLEIGFLESAGKIFYQYCNF